MNYKYQVIFQRSLADDQDFAEKRRPEGPLDQALREQFTAELEAHPKLKGTFTITIGPSMDTPSPGEYQLMVVFESDLPPAEFRAQLQTAYDEFGLSGHFAAPTIIEGPVAPEVKPVSKWPDRITAYRTSDGEIYDLEEEAQRHQVKIDCANDLMALVRSTDLPDSEVIRLSEWLNQNQMQLRALFKRYPVEHFQ